MARAGLRRRAAAAPPYAPAAPPTTFSHRCAGWHGPRRNRPGRDVSGGPSDSVLWLIRRDVPQTEASGIETNDARSKRAPHLERGAAMGATGKARALAGLRITMGLLFIYAGVEK